MSLVHWLQAPGGTLVDITDRVQKGKSFGEKAEEGSTWQGTVVVEDPLGDLEVFGHRVYAVEETEAVDPLDRFIFVGFVNMIKVTRGKFRTGAARIYTLDISDANTILERRVMTGGDNERPEESDVERITWVESTHEGEAIDDTRYLLADDPEDMDEADYNTQTASQVYADCGNQAQKNWFLTYFGDVGVTTESPWGSFSLWYGDPDPESGVYESTAQLTNIESETDVADGRFYIGVEESTELTVDPSRIYSKVVVPYANGYVKATNGQTVETYGRRDMVMPAENVKKAATAQRRANRYVSKLNTPEHRATVKTTVPRSLVNLIRAGMSVPIKASHWPHGYADGYIQMRVLSRVVTEISDDPDASFELTLELSRSEPGPPPVPVYGVLYGSDGPHSNLVYFARTGDNPGPGWQYKPKTGAISYLEDLTPPHGRPYYGFEVTGTGTIDVKMFLTTYGIKMNDIVYTWSVHICLNGVSVADVTFNPTPGNLSPQGWDPTVTITGLSVAPGDLVTGELRVSPSFPAFWRTPRGSGQNGERLEITGGSLS